jgi:lipopolysaccharide export system permease protein
VILQRYVMREYAKTFGMIIGGLIIIYFSTRLASYLGQAADGKMAPGHIVILLMLRMVVSMRDLIPMSLYIGIFAAIVRLERDSELTALRAAGAGHSLFLIAALKLGLLSAIAVGALTLFVEPRAEEIIEDIKNQTENEATIAGVKAGRFKELSGGSRIFYAEKISHDELSLENAFVQIRESAGDVGLLRSDDAFVETDEKTKDRFAIFLDGTSYAGRPGALDYVVTQFSKYALRIESHAPTDVSNEVNYMHTGDLLKYDSAGFRSELEWRLARPIGALLVPLLAVLIGLVSTGENWYFGLLIAISGYFIYSNMLGVAHAMINRGSLAPEIGMWLVQIGLLSAIAALYWFQRNPRRRRARAGSA